MRVVRHLGAVWLTHRCLATEHSSGCRRFRVPVAPASGLAAFVQASLAGASRRGGFHGCDASLTPRPRSASPAGGLGGAAARACAMTASRARGEGKAKAKGCGGDSRGSEVQNGKPKAGDGGADAPPRRRNKRSAQAAGLDAAPGPAQGDAPESEAVRATPPAKQRRLSRKTPPPPDPPLGDEANSQESAAQEADSREDPAAPEADMQDREKVLLQGLELVRSRWIKQQVSVLLEQPRETWAQDERDAVDAGYNAMRLMWRKRWSELDWQTKTTETEAKIQEVEEAGGEGAVESLTLLKLYQAYIQERVAAEAAQAIAEAERAAAPRRGPGRPAGAPNKKEKKGKAWWKGYMLMLTFISWHWGLVPAGTVEFMAQWTSEDEVEQVCAKLKLTPWFQRLREKALTWLKAFRTQHGFPNFSWSLELCLDTWRKKQKLLVHVHFFLSRETWYQIFGDCPELKFQGTNPYSDGRILNGGWEPDDFKDDRHLDPYSVPKMEAPAGHAYVLIPKFGQVECDGNKRLFHNWAVNPEWITRYVQVRSAAGGGGWGTRQANEKAKQKAKQ